MQLVVLEMPGKLPGVPQPNTFDLQPNPARPLIFIGRQADNDIILADASVSRHHVEVQISPSELLVRDLGSANGTWLNNEQLAPQVQRRLLPGDRLRVGNVLTTLKLLNSAPIEDVPTTALDSKANQATAFNQAAPSPGPNYNSGGYNPAQGGYSTPNYNNAPSNNPDLYTTPLPQGNYNPMGAQPPAGYDNRQSGGYSGVNNNYNPVEYTPGYVPVQPAPMPRQQTPLDNYIPDDYANQYAVQNSQSYNPAQTRSAAASRPAKRPGRPFLLLVPLMLAVVAILGVGGFLVVQALNKNTTSNTTLEQLNLPASPASANSISTVLGVSVPVFNNWKRTQDATGNRVVFSKPGQPTTALTIEKPPSATLLNGNLSPDAAVRQYTANVLANGQNVTVSTQPIQVKLKDGNLATIAIMQFSVPNQVTDYRMHALALQCGGNLYFVTAAAENKNDDATTDTDLKAAISNTRCP